MRVLVKGCILEGERRVNILVEEGIISKVSEEEINTDAEVIEAEGIWAIPGLVDLHVHTRVPGQEYKEDLESVSRAALKGGYTHILSMPNTDPPIDSPEILEYALSLAKDLPIYVFFTATLTKGRKGREMVEMGMLHGMGAKGFTDDGSWVEDDSVMLNLCTYASYFGCKIISHAEKPSLSRGFANYDINTLKYGMRFRLPIAEELAVYRDCRIAELTGCHLHIAHISYSRSVEIVKKFKEMGVKVTCEVTPHHLIFSTDRIDLYNPNFICNPPIRDEENRKALVKALREGIIDFIATDHAPHAYHEKEAPVGETLPGIEGLETAFSALYTHLVLKGELDLKTLIDAMSRKPAKFLGVDNSIREGNEANFFLFDPNERWVVKEEDILSKGKNNPFLGSELVGKVVGVFAKGKFLKEDRI
jgi:dihydroorotase, multifunctional complex type